MHFDLATVLRSLSGALALALSAPLISLEWNSHPLPRKKVLAVSPGSVSDAAAWSFSRSSW